MSLTDFRTLGRSGLIVSPLSLGTMTFGTPRWGSADDMSEAIFDTYIEAGGNFIDTADVYAGGRSEELVGGYIAHKKLRDKLVLATKFGFNAQPGNPHAGGNGRKNIYRALEGSLRRLHTDYIDLYWLHVWDMVTPVEEVLQTLGDLVRAGKIRYFGFSDMPAWYAAKAATLAQAHAVPGPIAMQLAYSLVERSIEREHIPAAREGGLGIVPWSPLAAGFLAGKYQRDAAGAPTGEGRLSGPNPFGNTLFTDRNWRILDALRAVAAQADQPLTQVALAWALAQPGVQSLIIGASKVAQLTDNLAALDVRLTPEQLRQLDEASALEPTFPYPIFTPAGNKGVFGGTTVRGWQDGPRFV
jgi:aryl-alcohol dehydrogenase-like predicted oxidoreductase